MSLSLRRLLGGPCLALGLLLGLFGILGIVSSIFVPLPPYLTFLHTIEQSVEYYTVRTSVVLHYVGLVLGGLLLVQVAHYLQLSR